MRELKKLGESFVYAFRGIAFCVRNERNMRIHVCAAVYAFVFALIFYDFTKSELALLSLTCALVISLETVNTAIEKLTDKASPEFSKSAKVVKDAAAGAVLVSAVAAVTVGVTLFWSPAKFREIADYFSVNVFALAALALSLILTCIFVFSGGKE